MTELRRVKIEGFVSTTNSSETPLIADAKFSGSAIEILDYGIVFVSVYADVASAVDGLEILQSIDGINWDFSDEYTIGAGHSENYSVNPHAKYLKVDYTNGGTGQGVGGFRLQTVLKGNSKPSSHSIKGDITNDDDGTLNISVIKVQTNDEETYKNVDVQNPLPSDGDSVYGKDLDLSRTITSGWTGDVSDLFGDLTEGLVQTGATNPKIMTIYFRRAVITNALGLGAQTGSFSNVKLTALLSGGVEGTIYDGSADDTDRTSQQIQFSPAGILGLRIEFHTTDDITLTNVTILKSESTVSTILAKSELSDLVENISSYRGALNVNSAWVHRKIVNSTFHQDTATTTTLSSPASEGDTSVVVVSATGFVIGNKIKIVEGSLAEAGAITITNVVGTTITLDRPLGYDYTVAADVTKILTNMNLVGTLASPQLFVVHPPVGTIWQLTRVMFSLVHASAADDSKFGSLAALTNGLTMRAVTAAGRSISFGNWKTNSDMKLDMYDITYTDKAGGGLFGTNGRWTFTRAEVIAELDGDASPIQTLQCLNQDDLSALTLFEMRAQGRVFSP